MYNFERHKALLIKTVYGTEWPKNVRGVQAACTFGIFSDLFLLTLRAWALCACVGVSDSRGSQKKKKALDAACA